MAGINEKIDYFGTDMQWMKNALIEWAKAIDHDDNTNALIEKYCKEDQKKADVSLFSNDKCSSENRSIFSK